MPERQDRARVKGRKLCHAVRCCLPLFLWQSIVLCRPSCRGTNGPVSLLFISSATVKHTVHVCVDLDVKSITLVVSDLCRQLMEVRSIPKNLRFGTQKGHY